MVFLPYTADMAAIRGAIQTQSVIVWLLGMAVIGIGFAIERTR